MKPSSRLNQAIDALMDLKIENLKEWTVLFSKIPIYLWCSSSIPELANKEIKVDYEDPKDTGGDHILYVLILLEKRVAPNDDDVVGVTFNANNKARIDSIEESDHDKEYPELVAIGFFGFEGTWNAVVSKLVEASKLLIQKSPSISI